MAAANPFDIKPNGYAPAQAPNAGIINNALGQITPESTVGRTTNATTTNARANTYNAGAADTREYQAERATALGYDARERTADQWNVDSQQTVQGQLAGVLDSNSPVLQRARAQAMQLANSRGLINSSMAAEAGTGAVIDRALQIATPDAQTFATAGRENTMLRDQAGRDNQAAVNQSRQFNTGEANQTSRFNTDQVNTASRTNATEANQTSRFNVDAANVAARTNTAAQNQAELQNAEAANRASIANAQAANTAVSETARFAQEASVLAQNQRFQAATAQYDALLKTSLADADALNRQYLTVLDGQVKDRLASIEAEFKTQMQTSQSAAAMYSEYIRAAGSIMTDQNLDAGAKQAMLDQQFAMMQNGLRLQQQISSVPGLDAILQSLGAPTVTAPIPSTNAPAPSPNNPIAPAGEGRLPMPRTAEEWGAGMGG